MIRAPRTLLASALSLALASLTLAQTKPLAPALNSNLGATYTLYLNFSGFDYRNVANPSGTGRWGATGRSPGLVRAYSTDNEYSTFSTDDQNAIRNVWARYANAYQGFDVNITTVDPAANLANDAARQAYYDRTQYLQQTIIGGTYNWYGSAGGVSYLGVTQNANESSGRHTNWVFPENGTGTDPSNVAVAGIHENGHALRLPHQRDETTGAEYTRGDFNGSNNRAPGTYGAIMGDSYYTQRVTWRAGSSRGNVNDVAELQRNTDIKDLADDGIGHSFATATALAVKADGTVDVNSDDSKGFIMPTKTDAAGYNPNAYTRDYFAFGSAGGVATLTAHDGNSLLQAGVADPGATLRSVMKIYTSTGSLVGTAVESGDTMSRTFTANLAKGQYYAEIMSYGAYISSHEPGARYYNMGGYFLTGSGIQAVPEPASMLALAVGATALLRRRKK